MTHLFGNVIEHRKDNTFLVSLNDGTVVNAIIPKGIARIMFRVVSGDPVAIDLSESEGRIKFQDSLLAVTLSAIGMKTPVAFVTDGVVLPISSRCILMVTSRVRLKCSTTALCYYTMKQLMKIITVDGPS